MSGDGSGNQRKLVEYADEQSQDDTDGSLSQYVTSQRPRTSRPGQRQQQSLDIGEEDPPGAVGGEGISSNRTLTEEEKRVGNQAQFLLESFIMDRCESDELSTTHTRVIQENVCCMDIKGRNPDDLTDVSTALRRIGDQLAQDYDLNRLIDMVPIQSPKEIFMKVCAQMFEDGQFNWGRVVALFYFAYRLIIKAIVNSVSCVPWIKDIISWAMDYFYQYMIIWIIQRGGWKMIQEYWGSSPRAVTGIVSAAILTVLFVWWKQ